MKLGIAHQNALIRSTLERCAVREFGVECVFTVGDSVSLLQRMNRDRPDIVLLDLALPGASVLELTRTLMSDYTCAILLLENPESASMSLVFECLGLGASDVARVPHDRGRLNSVCEADFRGRLSTLLRLSGYTRPQDPPQYRPETTRKLGPKDLQLIVIGASTGGPKALASVLSALASPLNAAVIIVQHLDVHFYRELAEWLASRSRWPVVPVTSPMSLEGGKVYLAARAEHLILAQGNRLAFTSAWPDLICRPSIDVFFRSVAEMRGRSGVGVLLTGMGRDGAEGLLALRQAGFHTVAQDAETSIIDGMPKAARELGAARQVLPLESIGAHLLRWLSSVEGSGAV